MKLLEKRGLLQLGGWGCNFRSFYELLWHPIRLFLKRTNYTVDCNCDYWFDSEQSSVLGFVSDRRSVYLSRLV